MKRVFLICAALTAMNHLYAQKAGVTITGKVPAIFNGEYIFLSKGAGFKNNVLDSAKVEKGAFSLAYPLEDTIQGSIRVTKKTDGKFYYGNRTLFLKPGDNVSLTAKDTAVANVFESSVLKGAPLTMQYDQLQGSLKKVNDSLQVVRGAAMGRMRAWQEGKLKIDTAAEIASRQVMDNLLKQKSDITDAFIDAHPDYYISLLSFKESLGSRVKDVPAAQQRLSKFTPALRNSTFGLGIKELLNASAKLGINQLAPDFASKTPDGKTLKLSDLKGKYVLLDFWASWCGPCRAENPNVVKAYNQYKDKNFTVLGVSLDREGAHDKWTEAIEKDGLTWHHVSDLKWWNADAAKLYLIHSIPQNFLIDPNGRIIAQNLRGEALQQELEKVIR